MKSDAIAAVGIALIDFALTVEPYAFFREACAEMESGTGAALARLTVAKVHPIRFTRRDYSKRAAVALPGSFHRSPPAFSCSRLWLISSIAVEPLPTTTGVRESQYRHWLQRAYSRFDQKRRG